MCHSWQSEKGQYIQDCYNCFNYGEDKCPHAQYMQPIINAMKEADGIIFTSPVYALAESAAVKALLEHTGYMFMPHRPMEEMFSKIAMVISTTAGAGVKYPIKTISRSLRYWGVKRVYKCGFAIWAWSWDEMNIKRKAKFENILRKNAESFYGAVKNRNRLNPRIFTKFIFGLMRKMMNNYDDGHYDKEYWRNKGWLDGKKVPF